MLRGYKAGTRRGSEETHASFVYDTGAPTSVGEACSPILMERTSRN